jgi:hypothetical protein
MIFIWSQGRIFGKLETMRLAIAVETSPLHSLTGDMRQAAPA